MPDFIIYCRYQYNTGKGVDFTKWFPCDVTKRTEAEAIEVLNQFKEDAKEIDKKTKLKHEYEVRDCSEFDALVKEIAENKAKKRTIKKK